MRLKEQSLITNIKNLKDKFFISFFKAFPGQLTKWAGNDKNFKQYSSSPWTPLRHPVNKSRVALVTTGGIHLRLQKPFNMDAPKGDPSFREIPATSLQEQLQITHNYYDHKDADSDVNIVLPLKRLHELKEYNEIGSVNHRHFSFMGHIHGNHLDTLINYTAPEVASLLKSDGVDIVILTPT